MVKSASTNLADRVARPTTNMAACIRIAREDGTLLAFTEHDQPLTFNPGALGSILHHPGFTRSAISNREGLNVDNFDLDGIIDSEFILEEDLRARKYDHAEVWLYWVDWEEVESTDELYKLKRGRIGEIAIQDDTFRAQFRSLTERLKQEIIEIYTPDCRYDLGETRCGVQLAGQAWSAGMSATVRSPQDGAIGTIVFPTVFNDRFFEATTVTGVAGGSEPTWNTTLGGTTVDNLITWTTIQALTVEATVSSIVEENRVFTIVGAPFFDGDETWFLDGKLFFTDVGSPTSQNILCKPGLIKDFSFGSPADEATVTLFMPMPFAVEIGDTVALQVGCDKLLTTCIEKFDNLLNFGGFPHFPGNDELFRYPDSIA